MPVYIEDLPESSPDISANSHSFNGDGLIIIVALYGTDTHVRSSRRSSMYTGMPVYIEDLKKRILHEYHV